MKRLALFAAVAVLVAACAKKDAAPAETAMMAPPAAMAMDQAKMDSMKADSIKKADSMVADSIAKGIKK
ncbi:MAG: hypothetical protein ABI120_17725 [Gemmatimonadaceae bacterium]